MNPNVTVVTTEPLIGINAVGDQEEVAADTSAIVAVVNDDGTFDLWVDGQDMMVPSVTEKQVRIWEGTTP